MRLKGSRGAFFPFPHSGLAFRDDSIDAAPLRRLEALAGSAPVVRLTAAAAAADRPMLRRLVSMRGSSPDTYYPSDAPTQRTGSGPAPPSSDRERKPALEAKKLFALQADDMIRRQPRVAWVDAAVRDSSPLANLIFSDRAISD
ncbi:hypothetical protein DL766_006483 [Monosporascus sp. MC13-8B]|uniref:Uncharacterized protein n=1 Tax=Monosporascus cannonballus TaxID=155416 RepID=A0ABY0GX17_9PEZI|nr:hypothetical protein DL763_010102 [Monosporascus cannonballus]RYO77438.1 hypothetical protein DL762_009256 [Monosporascus cannonballus]RYP27209.1 hypothetical protein DL766_006483 [Monosporascus sp. MC13-8B]